MKQTPHVLGGNPNIHMSRVVSGNLKNQGTHLVIDSDQDSRWSLGPKQGPATRRVSTPGITGQQHNLPFICQNRNVGRGLGSSGRGPLALSSQE